jgi:translation initiation factor 2 alpha subunit (eIF-2alpha)
MNKFNIRFNEKTFTMKWHEKEYPEVETVVICRIDQIDEYGIKVSILNYGNIRGFLSTKELSRKKIRSLRSIIKVGDIKPLIVINKEIKKDQVIIDLSYKQISNIQYEIDCLEKYYRLTNIIHTWLKCIYNSRYIIDGKYTFSDLTNDENVNLLDEETDKIFSYGTEIWHKVMTNTLWKYPINEVYNIFMNIKMGNEALKNAFPDLIEEIYNNKMFINIDNNQQIKISIDHLEILSNLINKFINYDIFLKLNLKLISWSINSLETISSILKKIQLIPEIKYNSNLSFNSIIINSPSYEFIIKTTNKVLIDKIYPQECSIEESEFGQYIIEILKEFNNNIDYGIELERKDVY